MEIENIEHIVGGEYLPVDDIAGGVLRVSGQALSDKSNIEELTYAGIMELGKLQALEILMVILKPLLTLLKFLMD